MRDIGCEECESQIRELTRSRSLTVFKREAIWRSINHECRYAGCAALCPTRSLVSRVSANLAAFVEHYSQVQLDPECPDPGTLRLAAHLVN